MQLIKLGTKLQKKLKILSSAKFSNTDLNIQKDIDELEFDAISCFVYRFHVVYTISCFVYM